MSDTRTQVRLRPVIRVFVSSTFSDLKHERNALEADAFPKLEQLCQREGFQFQAIDLRWGISTEAGLDHRTMRICIDELRRAQEISPRPNFLILLGNRYGWRPLPEEISVEEFLTLEHAAAQIHSSGDRSAVVTLRQWYYKDTNTVPPVYLLQSRRQRLGDGQDYTEDAVWNQIQAVLWTIINRAMPPKQLQRRFDASVSDGSPPVIVRFQASATEQEIWHGALRVPDAREHVLAFFRNIENLAAFADPKQIKDFVDIDSSGSVEFALHTEQDRLKTELRNQLGSANIFRNEVPVQLVETRDNQGGRTTDVTTDHLAQLCADVVSRLSEIIQRQIEEYWRKTAQASTDRVARELEIEQREYDRFAQERGGEDSFVGRQAELQAILDYVGSDSRWPMVIHGASGCGKTALLARASQEVAKTRKRIERFIGVAPRSSDLRSLLSSLCQELQQRNPRADGLPTEIKELGDEFFLHLQAATPDQPLFLFLDALDQLADADNGRQLNWLPPGSLPSNVKLIVSCLSDRATDDPASQPYAELKRRQIPAENFINLGVLSEAEARMLIHDRWLPKAGRMVSDGQRARIEQRLASPACRQPIYLKLLFEEVRLWRSFDATSALCGDIQGLLGNLFDRLGSAENHGRTLEDVLSYLASARRGLVESEILEILYRDPDYHKWLEEAVRSTGQQLPCDPPRIPIAIWSRLRSDLAPYLTELAAPGGTVLNFYHRQVLDCARQRFLGTDDKKRIRHHRLAMYFEHKDYWLESLDEQLARARRLPPTLRPANRRKVDELPWQYLTLCREGARYKEAQPLNETCNERLFQLLCDPAFLEASCASSRIYDLCAECNSTIALATRDDEQARLLQIFARLLEQHADLLNRDPYPLQYWWPFLTAQQRLSLNDPANSECSWRPIICPVVDRAAQVPIATAVSPIVPTFLCQLDDGQIVAINPEGEFARFSVSPLMCLQCGQLPHKGRLVSASRECMRPNTIRTVYDDGTYLHYDVRASSIELSCDLGLKVLSADLDNHQRWDLIGTADFVIAINRVSGRQIRTWASKELSRVFGAGSRIFALQTGGRLRRLAGLPSWHPRILSDNEMTSIGGGRIAILGPVLEIANLVCGGSIQIRQPTPARASMFRFRSQTACERLQDGSIACGNSDGSINLYSRRGIHILRMSGIHGDRLVLLRGLADGSLMSVSGDRRMCRWECVTTGRTHHVPPFVLGRFVDVSTIAGAQNGNWILGHGDGRMTVVTRDGIPAFARSVHSAKITAVLCRRDGQLISFGRDGYAYCCDSRLHVLSRSNLGSQPIAVACLWTEDDWIAIDKLGRFWNSRSPTVLDGPHVSGVPTNLVPIGKRCALFRVDGDIAGVTDLASGLTRTVGQHIVTITRLGNGGLAVTRRGTLIRILADGSTSVRDLSTCVSDCTTFGGHIVLLSSDRVLNIPCSGEDVTPACESSIPGVRRVTILDPIKGMLGLVVADDEVLILDALTHKLFARVIVRKRIRDVFGGKNSILVWDENDEATVYQFNGAAIGVAEVRQ